MYQCSLRQWAYHHELGMALAVRLGHVHRQDHNTQNTVSSAEQMQGLEGMQRKAWQPFWKGRHPGGGSLLARFLGWGRGLPDTPIAGGVKPAQGDTSLSPQHLSSENLLTSLDMFIRAFIPSGGCSSLGPPLPPSCISRLSETFQAMDGATQMSTCKNGWSQSS